LFELCHRLNQQQQAFLRRKRKLSDETKIFSLLSSCHTHIADIKNRHECITCCEARFVYRRQVRVTSSSVCACVCAACSIDKCKALSLIVHCADISSSSSSSSSFCSCCGCCSSCRSIYSVLTSVTRPSHGRCISVGRTYSYKSFSDR